MFQRSTLSFLRDLAKNNNKDWFQANKGRYEEHARDPMLEFVRAMEPRLAKISPHIVASDKKVGGSMMRIYRDVRFSKDKSPYNTFLAAQFRHEKGGLGFYARITAGECTLGTGIWRPETKEVARIRKAIVADPKAWKAARDAKPFRDTFGDLAGESLKRPPRGFPAEHPYVEDLKRKDFVGFCEWKAKTICERDFPDQAARAYRSSKKLMAFLCDALGLKF